MAHVVAVEHRHLASVVEEGLDQLACDGGLARTRIACAPEDGSLVTVARLPVGRLDGPGLPLHIGGASRLGMTRCRDVLHGARQTPDHPGGHGTVGDRVDEDEAAGAPVGVEVVEEDRSGGLDRHTADLVQFEVVGRFPVERVHVDPIADVADPRIQFLGRVLENVLGAPVHGVMVHPAQVGFELVGHVGQVARADDHVAATDVDFVLEGQHHRLAGEGRVRFAVVGDDGFDPGGSSRR